MLFNFKGTLLKFDKLIKKQFPITFILFVRLELIYYIDQNCID